MLNKNKYNHSFSKNIMQIGKSKTNSIKNQCRHIIYLSNLVFKHSPYYYLISTYNQVNVRYFNFVSL